MDDSTFGRAPTWYGTIVEHGTPLYWQFNNYKHFAAATQPQLEVVTSLLSLASWTHADAIATVLGDEPTAVCAVPSSRGTPVSQQRLGTAIRLCRSTKPLYRELLSAAPGMTRDKHTVQPEYFRPIVPLRGQRIVLVEDLAASGATAFSAWLAVRRAGAQAAILTVGRGVKPSFPGARRVLDLLPEPPWAQYLPTDP